MKRHLAAVLATLIVPLAAAQADEDLVAHWKFISDAKDAVGNHHAISHGVEFKDNVAVFNGIDAWLEVPLSRSLKFGSKDFSIAVWIYTDEHLDDVLGDVISCYDSDSRTGFNLTLMNYAGVTSAQSNWRNLLFGIDDGQKDSQWTDCGRPGTNQQIKSLVVFDGNLYAAVWEPDGGQAGQQYRYAGGTRWIDCGSPDKANAITGMAVFRSATTTGDFSATMAAQAEALRWHAFVAEEVKRQHVQRTNSSYSRGDQNELHLNAADCPDGFDNERCSGRR